MGYTQYQEYRRTQLRVSVAGDIARMCGYDYNAVLRVLDYHKVFGKWSMWELNNRPVNVEELAEIVAEALD